MDRPQPYTNIQLADTARENGAYSCLSIRPGPLSGYFDVATHLVHGNGEVLGVAGLGRRVDQTSEQVEANRASVGSVVLATQGSVCRVSCPPTEDHPGRIWLGNGNATLNLSWPCLPVLTYGATCTWWHRHAHSHRHALTLILSFPISLYSSLYLYVPVIAVARDPLPREGEVGVSVALAAGQQGPVLARIDRGVAMAKA